MSDCKPFWTSKCKNNSKKLWFPLEGKSTWNKIKSNSWFSIQKKTNVNLQKTCFQLPTFTPDDKWVEDDRRTRKIRLYPTQKQALQLKEWLNTSRYVYNRALGAVNEGEGKNFYKLRNKYVIAKNNPLVKDWEKKTPKDVRAGAIQDLIYGFKAQFQKLKNKTLKHFKMRFRKKKENRSIRIPKTAVKLIKDKRYSVVIYKKFIGKIKIGQDKCLKDLILDHDFRLSYKNGEWYLHAPVKVKSNRKNKQKNICALDPGIRSFQTSYAENEIYKFNCLDKLKNCEKEIDDLRGVLARKGKDKRSALKRKIRKKYSHYNHMIDDMQYKTIRFLTRRYKQILLPHFKSQEMVGKNRKVNRWLLDLKHYQFKQRLISKCCLEKHSSVMIVNESYTTKTCGVCGYLNSVKQEKIINCLNCNVVVDRDINGARNIFLKYVSL